MRPFAAIGSGSQLWRALVVAGIVLASGSAFAAGATPFGKNLVKNPGAEAGGTGTNVPNWEIDTGFSVEAYGTPGLPSKKQGKNIDGDKQLFSTGPYDFTFDTCPGARQSIKLKGIFDAIDAGNVQLTLSAALGTENKSDTAIVIVQFRDGNNHQVGPNLEISASTAAKMTEKTRSNVVPKKTRAVNVLLQGDVIAQTCNAFFDNVSVVLQERL